MIVIVVPKESKGCIVPLLSPTDALHVSYASMLRTTSGLSLVVHHQDQRERKKEKGTTIDKKEDRGGWVPFRDLWDHPFNTPPQPSHSVNQSSLDGALRGDVRG